MNRSTRQDYLCTAAQRREMEKLKVVVLARGIEGVETLKLDGRVSVCRAGWRPQVRLFKSKYHTVCNQIAQSGV